MIKLFIPICLLTILFTGCEEDDSRNIIVDNSEIITGDGALNDMTRDAYDLNYIGYEDGELQFNVSYGGGCEEHQFSFRWDETLSTENDVVIANIYVDHNGNNDNCEAYLTETISIPLPGLIPEDTNESIVFKFINSSNEDRWIYFSKSYVKVQQSNSCNLELELTEALCGYGAWDNSWFQVSEDRSFLQPVIVPENIETPSTGNLYNIGVKYLFGYRYEIDGAICLAYPGESYPVEITCIEQAE